jgi:hypothetical protein
VVEVFLKALLSRGVCRYSRYEKEVREILEAVWKNPEQSRELSSKATEKNREVYELEKMLENNPFYQQTATYLK